jgi:hypothetical protein
MTVRAKKGSAKSTIGEVEDLLEGAYDSLSVALRNPPSGQAQTIVSALNLIEEVLNQIIIQKLHQDAVILKKLSEQLKNVTQQLTQLKNDLQQLSAVTALGTSLLNTIATILPFL